MSFLERCSTVVSTKKGLVPHVKQAQRAPLTVFKVCQFAFLLLSTLAQGAEPSKYFPVDRGAFDPVCDSQPKNPFMSGPSLETLLHSMPNKGNFFEVGQLSQYKIPHSLRPCRDKGEIDSAAPLFMFDGQIMVNGNTSFVSPTYNPPISMPPLAGDGIPTIGTYQFMQECAKGALELARGPYREQLEELRAIDNRFLMPTSVGNLVFHVGPGELDLIPNYEKAMQKGLEFGKSLQAKTASELVGIMRDVHAILMRGEAEDAGNFRTGEIIAFADPDGQAISWEQRMERVREKAERAEKGTGDAAAAAFNQTARYFQPQAEDSVPLYYIDPKDREFLKSAGFYVGPRAPEVPDLAFQFANELKKGVGDGDVVATAAYILREMGRILPFRDGNHRVAQILASSISTREGYPSVSFPKAPRITAHSSPVEWASAVKKSLARLCKAGERLKELGREMGNRLSWPVLRLSQPKSDV